MLERIVQTRFYCSDSDLQDVRDLFISQAFDLMKNDDDAMIFAKLTESSIENVAINCADLVAVRAQFCQFEIDTHR